MATKSRGSSLSPGDAAEGAESQAPVDGRASPVGGGRAWPGANTGAVALTFDVDARSVMLAADPSSASRASLMSHQDYGPLVGVPRLLDLLRDCGVRAT